MKNKITILISLLLLTILPGRAGLAEQADSAYNAKEYVTAISLWRQLLETDGSSPELLYNLGNACYQEGDYGNAMLYWQRARRINPDLPELNANIRYLQSRVEDANKAEQKGKRYKVTVDEPSFFQSVHKSLAEDTSSDSWAVWGAVAFILFVAALATYIFSRNVLARKIGFFGGFSCLLLSVIFVSFAIMAARHASSRDTGVVTAFKVSLLTEPGKENKSDNAHVLTKGTEVRILSEEADAEGTVTWYKVRLNSDYIGWIPASDMETI